MNSSDEVLLFLRDNKPDIPYPNRWDVLGGAVELGETPRECIVREMKEEIEYTLEDPQLFTVTDFHDRVEYTYFQRADLDLPRTPLHEGQRLKWFSRAEIESLPPEAIAFGFGPIILEILEAQPWISD